VRQLGSREGSGRGDAHQPPGHSLGKSHTHAGLDTLEGREAQA
jgi:hypothetical protein